PHGPDAGNVRAYTGAIHCNIGREQCRAITETNFEAFGWWRRVAQSDGQHLSLERKGARAEKHGGQLRTPAFNTAEFAIHKISFRQQGPWTSGENALGQG